MRVALIAALVAGCDDPGTSVRVNVSCVPPGAATLVATFDYGAGDAASHSFAPPGGLDSEESFDVFLPRPGRVRVDIAAGGAVGTDEVQVPDQREVDIALGGGCSSDASTTDCPAGPAECGTPFRCPAGSASGPCYVACAGNRLGWDDAQAACAGWQGCLATVEDPLVAACVGERVGTIYRPWVGLRQQQAAGSVDAGWTWACTGDPVGQDAWYGPEGELEPDDADWEPTGDPPFIEDGEEDCGSIDLTFGWFDSPCSDERGFFCQR